MTLFQVTTMRELVEAIRQCPCTSRCRTCQANLDRMDTVLDRAHADVMREMPEPKGERN